MTIAVEIDVSEMLIARDAIVFMYVKSIAYLIGGYGKNHYAQAHSGSYWPRSGLCRQHFSRDIHPF